MEENKCSNCIHPIVVGIGGATRSGKSTLADSLRKKCFSVVDTINQDDYFKIPQELPRDPSCPEHPNWESTESLELEELERQLRKDIEYCTILCENCSKQRKRVHSSRTQPYYIFCEGFLIFLPNLLPLFTKKIYLIIDKATCYSRRMETFPVPEIYFQLIWPFYLKQNVHIPSISDVLLLDGTMQSEEKIELALKYVKEGEYHCNQDNYRNKLENLFK